MPFSKVPLTHRRSLGLAVLVVELGIAVMLAAGSLPGHSSTALAQSGTPSPGPPLATPAANPAATAGESSPNAPTVATVPEIPGHDFVKDRDAIFEKFYTTGLDTATAYAVSNLAIKKDNFTLLLKQGTIFLMRPIEGEITGAAFVGDGLASMTPPNGTVRFMLHKMSGTDTLQEPFSEAIFRFDDGTEKLLRVSGRPDPTGAAQAAHASDTFKDRNAFLDSRRDFHFETEFLVSRISAIKGMDFFVADFHTPKHDWLTYVYTPASLHENFLTASAMLGAGRRYLVPWAQWHKQSDYGQGGHYVLNPSRDGMILQWVTSEDLTIDLPNTKAVEWEAKQRIEPYFDGLRCLEFSLDNNAKFENRWDDDSFWPIKVTSVKDESGAPLQFQHKKDILIVILPQPTKVGVPVTLVTRGTANVIYQLTAESYGLLEDAWYPQSGYLGGRHPFHWTVKVPKPYLPTGSGKTIREFEDKDKNQNGIELVDDIPDNFPWVIFGRFQKDKADYLGEESKKKVLLTMHSFPTMTITITDEDTLAEIGAQNPITVTLSAPAKKVEGLLAEFKEILKLYENIYGPFPYDELHIAQMAPQMGFSQAPADFIQLTGAAFLSQAALESDFVHGHIAHEAAHQWWGHQVGWASGDDVWLSEGFAEYASGIFVKEYQGAKRFQRTLLEWKRAAKIGDKEAPITAASLLRGPNAGNQRYGLIYAKAPYVLHMLRVQLGDKQYVAAMHAIQEAYKNRNVSTEMVLAQINKATGQNYTEFFDQWVWGTGIPTFRYTWRSEKQPDGKFLISVHVSQDDKSNLKKVLMPVHIHFKDKTIPEYEPVVKAEQDIKIMSPQEPKDVTLDDDHTLLAEVVKAS